MSAPVVARLGCATNYAALIHYWDRSVGKLRYYTRLSGIMEVTWERVLDDPSECRVRFRPNQGDECCGKLKPLFDAHGQLLEPGVWPWAHELSLYRDGELVWQGPIFSVDELINPDETTASIQITARDFLGWLSRRAIHSDILITEKTDLSYIAERIIRDAFAPDDPGVLQHLDIRPSGRMGTHSVRYDESRADDELHSVARAGLDYTSVGRRIIVKGPGYDPATSTTQPILLRARDFQAAVEIRVVGAEAANVGVAVGGVPTQPEGSTTPIENIPPAKARYGSGDAFFGLIENWTRSEGVTNADFLLWVAKQKLIDGNPPPHTLSIPADSGLSPDAPVSIHHLVPSTYFTIHVKGTCRELKQYMRLSHLRGTWTDKQPEQIGVTFIPYHVLEEEVPA